MKIASCEAIPSIKEFFPSIKNDLTKVTWYHNVFTMMLSKGQLKLKFPLWLHADTDNMGEKDIDKFLSLYTHNFPEATISIGMLHVGQKFGSKREYNAKLVTQMKDTLTRNNVTQTVVFPVDLVGATYSLDTLPALNDVHGITDSALYMYAGVSNHLSDDEISRAWKLIKIFGRDRVYLDTEGVLHDQLFKTS
uniref:Menorin-like domain-containing protein n=1 Tax=Timema tahoe TaxID=61484 RepID=A0A7R9P054_9NEOP|nr:unnamed protein product [Timema tahoe]